MQLEDIKMESFSEVLKKLMRARGVTAKVVSQATGIPASTLSEWTAGRMPTIGRDVMRLARFFGVSIEFLITGQEPEEKIVGDILEDIGDGFTTLHKGVYRIRVEKYLGSSKKRKDE